GFSRDWSSDVCSSDLATVDARRVAAVAQEYEFHQARDRFWYLPAHRLVVVEFGERVAPGRGLRVLVDLALPAVSHRAAPAAGAVDQGQLPVQPQRQLLGQ